MLEPLNNSLEKFAQNAIIGAVRAGKGRVIVKKFTIVIIFIIFGLSMNLQATFIIGGSNGEFLLTDEELEGMPKESFIELSYRVVEGGKSRDVLVKGLSLRSLILERVGLHISDGDVILLRKKPVPVLSTTYKKLMKSSLKFVLAMEVDGVPVDHEKQGYKVYAKAEKPGYPGLVYEGVIGLKFGPEVSITRDFGISYFKDLGEDYKYAASAIQFLYQKGIVSGVGEEKFEPGKNITRAEMSKIANLSIGTDKVDYKGNFRDVSHADWFAPYVAQSVKKGFFLGYGDGSFRPKKNISRQEFCAVLARVAMDKGLVSEKELQAHKLTTEVYEDALSVYKSIRPAVAWLESKGALEEIARTKFEPAKPITRAEACRVLYITLFK